MADLIIFYGLLMENLGRHWFIMLLRKEMGPEILPLPNNLFPKEAKLFGRFSMYSIDTSMAMSIFFFSSHNAIERRHPNLIKMHTAFIDVMPILPDAKYLYPEVLPNSRDFDALFGSPKTLFIVMKRYV
jgi:hypothetical protein